MKTQWNFIFMLKQFNSWEGKGGKWIACTKILYFFYAYTRITEEVSDIGFLCEHLTRSFRWQPVNLFTGLHGQWELCAWKPEASETQSDRSPVCVVLLHQWRGLGREMTLSQGLRQNLVGICPALHRKGPEHLGNDPVLKSTYKF